uniref:Uncharacterized protein n=1 Tax=Oryza punctata TaxID=4537 RepID=A0A0E0JF76_ORYPU
MVATSNIKSSTRNKFWLRVRATIDDDATSSKPFCFPLLPRLLFPPLSLASGVERWDDSGGGLEKRVGEDSKEDTNKGSLHGYGFRQKIEGEPSMEGVAALVRGWVVGVGGRGQRRERGAGRTDLVDGEGVGLAGPREVVVPRGDPPLQSAGHRGEREPRPPPQLLQLQRLVPIPLSLAVRRVVVPALPLPPPRLPPPPPLPPALLTSLPLPRAGLRLLGQRGELMSLALATAAATPQGDRREDYEEEDEDEDEEC